jgi:predicted SAM-dependent methyltransferase
MSGDRSDGSIRATLSRGGKQAARALLGRRRTQAIGRRYYRWRSKRESRRFLERHDTSGLAINFGAGWRPLEDWVNVDIAAAPGIDVVHDVTEGLPFATGSAQAIFAEHLIEHLTGKAALDFLRECHRVLAAEGVIRLSTPDGGRYVRSYAGSREFLDRVRRPDEILDFDVINRVMREDGLHLWIYDEESLCDLVERAGFREVRAAGFRESRSPLMSSVDSPERAVESLYVEGSR